MIIPPVSVRQVRHCRSSRPKDSNCVFLQSIVHPSCKLGKLQPDGKRIWMIRDEMVEQCKSNFLPEEMEELIALFDFIRPGVFRFARLMEQKLRKNECKGGWESDTLEEILSKLNCKATEVKWRMDDGDPALEVALICADIANYSMMLAENYRKMETEGCQEAPCL